MQLKPIAAGDGYRLFRFGKPLLGLFVHTKYLRGLLIHNRVALILWKGSGDGQSEPSVP